MAEHKHGSMDIEAQEKTFAGFIRFATNAVIVVIVMLILVALING
ncbi:aa3-type cytochrome c oxidase subunit IV [Primorskyibacter flagellatus]|uniref:Aa3 type cytochrome c oxidase subunit IV n=1 Tax=Primorskyibacter flagellatus TaxID=1387277 RepID=A0A1W2AYA8_9RHOB|nr:aa3-type cytochrome c oxidase subunit IV [Primorskyibacter flagellatus]SMC65452.1 aa3 type cytochrome c oxidase subunit IV [Primorskyibacter flagellatus]